MLYITLIKLSMKICALFAGSKGCQNTSQDCISFQSIWITSLSVPDTEIQRYRDKTIGNQVSW